MKHTTSFHGRADGDQCSGCVNLDIEYYADACAKCARFYRDKYDDGLTDDGTSDIVEVVR